MEERLKLKTAVYILLEREGRLVFLRRFNTGYKDGKYTVPAGHVDAGEFPTETMVREVLEETDVKIDVSDLELVHVMYEKDIYIDFYFKADEWSGEPVIGEPDKADDIAWFPQDTLPEDKVVEKVRKAIMLAQEGVLFSEAERS